MTRFDERLHQGAWQSLEIGRELFRGDSEHQSILVFENPLLGRVLVLDGVVQTTEADEFVYHEMLAHVPMVGHGAVAEVLIVGGGDGGLLEEVLKHPVRRATVVELDARVVEVCREHLAAICGAAFDDPRSDLVIAEGAAYVAATVRRFDLVIVDSPDPIGPAQTLFERGFYADCRRALRPGGLLVTQNGVPFFQGEEVRASARAFAELFRHWGFYAAPVPTYYGGHMAFGWASAGRDLAAVPAAAIGGRAAPLTTRYYNGDVHAASFALPNYIRALLEDDPHEAP